MQVNTDSLPKLTAEVERMATLAQKFEALSARSLVSEVIYEAGRRDERRAILGGPEGPGRRPNPNRDCGSRAEHLCAVPEGRPS